MLTYDFLRSTDSPTEATTRRRLLHVPATVAATARLAALTAGGAARAAPETTATARWPAGSRWWVKMDLNFASIASEAGPINVHLSDNDLFAAMPPIGWANSARRCTSHGADDGQPGIGPRHDPCRFAP